SRSLRAIRAVPVLQPARGVPQAELDRPGGSVLRLVGFGETETSMGPVRPASCPDRRINPQPVGRSLACGSACKQPGPGDALLSGRRTKKQEPRTNFLLHLYAHALYNYSIGRTCDSAD